MSLARLLVLILLLPMSLATVDTIADTADAAENTPLLYPGIRFARSPELMVAEYLGKPGDDFPVEYRQLPVGRGNMQVDCQTHGRIGFLFEPVGVGNPIYGANTKYRTEWTHSAFPGQSYGRMHYRPRYTGYITTAITIEDWLENGTIRLVIRVEGEVVYETAFELENCLANMYRTPTPPSEMIRRYEEGDSDNERSSREE